MKNTIILIGIFLLLIHCKEKGIRRDFFSKTNSYPKFKFLKEKLPIFGFDSIAIDSLSTIIENKDYWYMSSAANGLLNINGYIRRNDKIIYIKTGDRTKGRESQEQILFDFSADSSKRWSIRYKRDEVSYILTFIMEQHFFNKLIQDTGFIFRAYCDVENTSLTKEFLIQSSLKQGLVSFRYLSIGNKRIYTIDYLPVPNVSFENVSTPIYPTQ